MTEADTTPILNPVPDAPSPPRAAFTESEMPGEPATDRRIEIADGTAMRERVAVRQIGAGADAMVSVLITTALLDDAGGVVRDGAGEVILSSHELTFSTEALGRLIKATSELAWVPRIVKTCEALYASAADLDPAGRTLCAQLAHFCALYNFHGMAIEDRGLRIMQAMQRRNGDAPPAGSGWPAEADDPPVHSDFAPAASTLIGGAAG